MNAPLAQKIPKKLTKHNDTRIDNYYWLNDKEKPEVIEYLNKENDYTEAILKDTEAFQTNLFEEMKARIKQDDNSVPYKKNGYWYQTQYNTGEEYPIFTRKKGALTAKEEILFNVNQMAKDFAYYQLGGINIAPNNTLAAYGVDTLSRRIYTLHFKDLETGKILDEKIENTTGGSVWAADNKTLFYTRKDEALRAYQIYKHILGTHPKTDVLIYEEKDETFSCFVYKTKSEKYIMIGSSATLSSEYRFIEADKPNSEFTVIQPRIDDLEYSVAHFGDDFYVLTNKDNATNFKVMKTSVKHSTIENWQEVIPHRKDVLIEGFDIFTNYLVVEERKNALININIKKWNEKGEFLDSYDLPFVEEVYTAGTSTNIEFNTNLLRYSYTSLTTPWSTIEFNMDTKQFSVLKEQEVQQKGFDKNNYSTKRLWILARDGKKVPVSIVKRKDTELTSETPLLLYAYGSYGYSIDPTFGSTRLSLLDRGFVYAIAHIRGGQELGREWYEDGKFFHKKNTFYDFIDVAKALINKNYTSSKHIYAYGGSAGGLLMGAVLNYEPTLFNGIIAAVPFVDVVTTMLDDSIPLTTGEYDEWGNPNQKDYYDYMKSYSPYDNVAVKPYTNILVTTGLHDSQVQYWEPAKWVAKLRELKTSDTFLLLKTNMDAGHGGASGRFEALKEIALNYAFLFKLEGIKK